MATCEVTELDEATCGHCQKVDLPGEMAVASSNVYIRKKAERRATSIHYSRCGNDRSHKIEPGEPIGVVDGFWVCSRCFT